MKAIPILLLVLFATSSAGGGAPAVETVMIRVTRLGNGDGWRAAYRLDRPADELRFFTDFRGRRAQGWTTGKGLRIVSEHGTESVQAVDGGAIRAAVLEFRSDATKLDRLYQLNQRFTDGSEWLNTAYLHVAPIRHGIQERKVEFQFHFDSQVAEPILLEGRRHERPVQWRETFEEGAEPGTFVYFGAIAPLDTPSALLVVDPGLPGHLRAIFEQRIPDLFAYYEARTGYALAQRPTILIAYAPDAPNPGYAGDTLGALVDFNFNGPGWADDDPATRETAFRFIAHEAAHLWNGERFRSADGDPAPWIHEGGAEAFALLAMRDFGVVDEPAFRAAVEKALNQCSDGLVEGALQAAAGKLRSGASYSCGLVMNLLVELELRAKGGLFAFWRALFASAERTASRYGLEQFFATLEGMAGDRRLAALLNQMWSAAVDDPARFLQRELQRQGVTAKVSAPPSEARRLHARRAMAFLMADDCAGVIDFRSEADHFRIGARPACKVLRADDEVVALAGEGVAADGTAAYDAVAKRCAGGKPIELGLADGRTVELRCTKPIPPRVPYLALETWPPKTKGPALMPAPGDRGPVSGTALPRSSP